MKLNEKNLTRAWVRGVWTGTKIDTGEGLCGGVIGGSIVPERSSPLMPGGVWFREWQRFGFVKPTELNIIIPPEFT